MPANWDDREFQLHSPEGTLSFNVPTNSPFNTTNGNYLYLLDHEKCVSSPVASTNALRLVVDPIPHFSGSQIHRAFKSGILMRLSVQLWIGDDGNPDDPLSRTPACGDDRQVMMDTLLLHLNALLNPKDSDLFGSNARIIWPAWDGFTIDGHGGADNAYCRMLERVRCVEWPTAQDEGRLTVVTFAIQTEFPYEMTYRQGFPSIVDNPGPTDPVILTNNGTVETYPVVQVYGPFEGFELINLSNVDTNGNAATFSYSGFQPGAEFVALHDYAEIDFFRNTIFLNGNEENLSAGIEAAVSDFWALLPGANEIVLTGAGSHVGGGGSIFLWNAGWN